MKKIMALLLSVVMVFSAFAASAKVPDFMRETYNNYTADYTLGTDFSSADDICSLLDELGLMSEIEKYVDLASLLEGLFGVETRMNVQCNISDDYKKMDVALTSASVQNVTVNPNLSADLNYGFGLWVHADFTGEEPELEVVYTGPLSNKYAVIDVMEIASREEAEALSSYFEAVLSPELMESITEASADLLEKYAHISNKGNVYTLHMDNDEFVLMVEELFRETLPLMLSAMEELPSGYGEVPVSEVEDILETISLKGLRLLGKDGITWVYELNPQGKISSGSMTADVELDIANIYELVSGEEWAFSAKGLIDLAVNMDMDITHIGKTVPDFPVLTEENSYYPDLGGNPIYEDQFENYPWSYVYDTMDAGVEKDGLVYFPLQSVMYNCYHQSLLTETTDNTVTMTSDYFDGFTYVTVTRGGSVALTDNGEYSIGEVIEKDGEVYVSEKFFTEVLGWTLEEYTVNVMNGFVSYGFVTNIDYDYIDIFGDAEERTYPNSYVWGMIDSLPERNGVYYVPLRYTMENAYENTVAIDYADGAITLSSPWFDGFDTIVVTIGSGEASVDGVAYSIDEVYAENGVTYVGVDFFRNLFGWTLDYYDYNRVDNCTDYEFITYEE